MNRLIPAALLAAAVLTPLPAEAAGTSCSVNGSNVTLVYSGGGEHWIGLTLDGWLSDDGVTSLDCGGGEPASPADKTISVSAGGTSAWVFDMATDWFASVVLDIATGDTLLVQGYEATDAWTTPVSAALDLELGQATALTLDTAPTLSTFDLGDGSSQLLDLTNWSGSTSIKPGSGDDAITGSPGSDAVSVIPDEAADVIDGAGGSDTLSFSETDENITYDPDEATEDGAEGEPDDYTGFETVIGGGGNDRLIAGPDGSDLHGGAGNDVLVAGPGDDSLLGEGGFDWVSYERSAGSVTIGPTQATFYGTDDLQHPSEGIIGGSGADLITIDSPGTVVRPLGGNDAVVASVGGVRLLAEDGPDGADTFTAPSGTWDYSRRAAGVSVTLGPGSATDGAPGEGDDVDLDVVIGGRGADTLTGSPEADTISGGPGKDVLNGLGGADTVRGDAGDDASVGGGAGPDLVEGGDGNDLVLGGEQADLLRGGAGNDFLDGGEDNDTEYGDAGNDVFDQRNIVNGTDQLFGGLGLDKARYTKRSKPLTLSNDGKANDGQAGEHDSIGIDVEWLIGGKNADALQGGPRADRLEGAEGNDVLNGWNANDLLVGGPGRDLLRGGSGADRLNSKDRERDEVYGGKGRDRARSDGLDLVAQVEGAF